MINNLRYADNTVLIASVEKGQQRVVENVKMNTAKSGLKVNKSKTKMMATVDVLIIG